MPARPGTSTKQNITSFTTDFTFKITANGYGESFVIQNDPRGMGAGGDSNGLGYFAYSVNPAGTAIGNSIAIAFNATPNGSSGSESYTGATPSMTGLYLDGGVLMDNGIMPVQDLIPQGINLRSGDVVSAHVVYDGAILSMALTDTVTGKQAYFQWPVNIPAVVGGDTAYIGFSGGTINPVPLLIDSWSWWQGYDTRLAAPTFSPAAGSYTSSQSVTISGPAGATIYYTTNGKPPTTASAVYSGPITVSSNEVVQAIAVESGYTNSEPAEGNYQIQAAGSSDHQLPERLRERERAIADRRNRQDQRLRTAAHGHEQQHRDRIGVLCRAGERAVVHHPVHSAVLRQCRSEHAPVRHPEPAAGLR